MSVNDKNGAKEIVERVTEASDKDTRKEVADQITEEIKQSRNKNND